MNKEIPKCISVANRIIRRTNAQNAWRYELGKPRVHLTTKRLQKILYLCQLVWYIDHEESNMIPEDFVAWPNGPVIPEIYNYWAVYQDGDICQIPNVNFQLNKEEIELINIIVDSTIDISTEVLIDYTHIPSGPWEQVYKNSFSPYSIILKDKIKQYICSEEAQRQLIDFITTKTTKYENSGSSKKLTPLQNKHY